jgi:hypothetical protein
LGGGGGGRGEGGAWGGGVWSIEVAAIDWSLPSAGYVEIDTPTLLTVAGGATAVPFETTIRELGIPAYLSISPELILKVRSGCSEGLGVCLGVWVFVGLWVCGFVSLWVCGFVSLWVCGFVGLWVCGFVGLWVCGFVGVCVFIMWVCVYATTQMMLVAGLPQVYSLKSVFRNEGRDSTHTNEFCMCEVYSSFTDFEYLFSFTEKLWTELVTEFCSDTAPFVR